jgi:hypothetical protein
MASLPPDTRVNTLATKPAWFLREQEDSRLYNTLVSDAAGARAAPHGSISAEHGVGSLKADMASPARTTKTRWRWR